MALTSIAPSLFVVRGLQGANLSHFGEAGVAFTSFFETCEIQNSILSHFEGSRVIIT